MMIKKGRNLTSGVRFSESARSVFSLWVQNKRVIEKGWTFDKKCSFDKLPFLLKNVAPGGFAWTPPRPESPRASNRSIF